MHWWSVVKNSSLMWHLIDLEVFHQMQSNVRLTLFFYVRWMIAAWNFMSCYNIKSIHTCPQHTKKCWNQFHVEVNESSILYKLVIPEFSKKNWALDELNRECWVNWCFNAIHLYIRLLCLMKHETTWTQGCFWAYYLCTLERESKSST